MTSLVFLEFLLFRFALPVNINQCVSKNINTVQDESYLILWEILLVIIFMDFPFVFVSERENKNHLKITEDSMSSNYEYCLLLYEQPWKITAMCGFFMF